jgi:sec-independent protein translocase protein TatA
MFGLGTPELIVILIIVVVIFGASKIPELGGAIGKGIRNFKKSMADTDKDAETKKLEDKDK